MATVSTATVSMASSMSTGQTKRSHVPYPTRAIARRLLRRYAAHRFVVVGVGGSRGAPPRPNSASRPYDFDGTAEEVEENEGDDRRLSP